MNLENFIASVKDGRRRVLEELSTQKPADNKNNKKLAIPRAHNSEKSQQTAMAFRYGAERKQCTPCRGRRIKILTKAA